MTQALRRLAEDFLSADLFLRVLRADRQSLLGIGVAVAVGLGQIARRKLSRQPVDAMQWVSLALVVVLGGARSSSTARA